MNSPKKRNSPILQKVQLERNNRESQRTRTSILLAAKINSAIAEQGWSKFKFAQALKTKPSIISKWLSGTHNFTTDTLTDIQCLLEIELLNLHRPDTGRSVSMVGAANLTVNICS
jgi:ribosome-binding protein aMBF1 (putative translation factor)